MNLRLRYGVAAALKAKQVWDASRAYAVSEVERCQAELDKVSGTNTASLEG
ncbi:hypothetical protein [Pandoraea communis]|uniref:Uncharacterized protein n=1 Tax=Pandoraea communis TaxID=2508297 RepID=A0A5E4SXI9_9BURK|nr:hypothetical protein [Pandoraea communis]MDM8358087.1 hypothetical protein [Pandoraea communis]VVD80357.1 hypothetical protein PCO31111_01084 [Pandoraea communis]